MVARTTFRDTIHRPYAVNKAENVRGRIQHGYPDMHEASLNHFPLVPY